MNSQYRLRTVKLYSVNTAFTYLLNSHSISVHISYVDIFKTVPTTL